MHWSYDSTFYHIYTLGFCGAPAENDFCSPPVPRLEKVYGWLDHIQGLGANALFLGPLFESTSHGYDVADYNLVDRRLGTNDTLKHLVGNLHSRGMRVILDGVFHHTGRDFWAFRDIQKNKEQSHFSDWYYNLRFEGQSPYGDPFTYEGWNGYLNLVKLNLQNPGVRQYLFRAVEKWIREFDIDGIRLDATDWLDQGFLKALAHHCHGLKPDFWLMGEVVHGDYRRWANSEMIDSITNYECYKGLYSSLVDVNYFEIAYALNRQFGPKGIYRDIPIYNFVDNHDVDRVASRLTRSEQLYPLYCLLFTMPGVPSIYYGSEWGLPGKKNGGDDWPLRPDLNLLELAQNSPQPSLPKAIKCLTGIRHSSEALKKGSYTQVLVKHEQLAFAREYGDEKVLVVLNASSKEEPLELNVPFSGGSRLVDLLNPGQSFPVINGKVKLDKVWPNWARILVLK